MELLNLFHNQGKGAPIGLPEWKRDTWVTPTDISIAEATALRWLYDNTDGDNWTTNTNWGTTATANDWYGVTVAGGKVTTINLNSNNLVGNIGAWAIDAFTAIFACYLHTNASMIGDCTSWAPPSTLGNFRMYSTGLTGVMTGWDFGAAMVQFHMHTTSLKGCPSFSSAVAPAVVHLQDTGNTQAQVDAILLDLYNRWATGNLTDATPVLYVGGDPQGTPSGAYADEDPPTTGLGAAYEVTQDPEATGYIKWEIRYRGDGVDVTVPP